MNKPIFLNKVSRWFNQFSLRTLEDAYQGAITIKAIEDKYFDGNKIASDSERGKSVFDYFQSTLERQLLRIRLDLAQFKASNFLVSFPQKDEPETLEIAPNNNEAEILDKLSFIEAVIGKYRISSEEIELARELPVTPPTSVQTSLEPSFQERPNQSSNPLRTPLQPVGSRSFFNLRGELSPEYEQEVVQQLRYLRQERKIAIRYLLLLILVPIFVQVVTKNLIFSPLINWKFVDTAKPDTVEISEEVAEEFLAEFAHFKEVLEIKTLLGITPELSREEERNLLREKAEEMGRDAAYQTLDGWKNILGDLTYLGAFAALIYFFRRQFTIIRQFISRYFLGLNDITKVFIFILLTDMFVGFHSAEGWEVIVGGFLKHLGLPENHNFINIFIATVPVIMDSIFKLLIFNFFTRKSPTAVAILEKMNQ